MPFRALQARQLKFQETCHWGKLIVQISLLDAKSSMHLMYRLLLLLGGDIETNPRPTYAVDKAVLGTFHQGDQRFGETAGVKCACNSLYALCWSEIRQVSIWKPGDLDHKLFQGDVLYKSLNTIDLLSADDLPRLVKIYEYEFDVTFLGLQTGQASLIPRDPFLRMYVPGHNVDEFLLFISGFTIAVITKGPNFYLFDSHSRDYRGSSVPDGNSVLLRFKDLFEIEKYIQVAYLE